MTVLEKFLTKQPSRKDFADMVTQSLFERGIVNVRFSQEDYSLRIGDEEKNTLFLSNTYADYCNAPRSKRRDVLARMTSAVIDLPAIPPNFLSAKEHLVPMIRDAAFFEISDLQLEARGTDPAKLHCPTKPIVGELLASLAYDTEHSMIQVADHDFDPWGISFDRALADAKDNLRERTDPHRLEEYAPGVYLGRWQDCNDSARMLLTDLMYRLSVYGDPVAFVPNRSELWVTGSKNKEGIGKILEAGETSHFERYPVSPYLYLLNDGTWQTYFPEDPEQRLRYLSIVRRRVGINYNEQKRALDAIHDREEIDVFVASYSIQTKPGGTDKSICIWANGVDSLLPKTELIALMTDEEGKDFIWVTWEEAARVAGDLLEVEPGLGPARYRVRAFPDEKQVAQLRAASTLLSL